MNSELNDKYLYKKAAGDEWTPLGTNANGVRILSIEGFNERGKALNVYTEQWLDSHEEDIYIAPDSKGDTKIVRENVSIKMTFIISPRYSNVVNFNIDTAYDTFLDNVTETDIWLKSEYVHKTVHCICLEATKTKQAKFQRGNDSYIIGEIEFHTLDKPQTY